MGRLPSPSRPTPAPIAPLDDQHDLPPAGPQPADLVGQRLHPAAIERAVRAGEHVGADLDDDGVRGGDDFLPNRIDHTRRYSKNRDATSG